MLRRIYARPEQRRFPKIFIANINDALRVSVARRAYSSMPVVIPDVLSGGVEPSTGR